MNGATVTGSSTIVGGVVGNVESGSVTIEGLQASYDTVTGSVTGAGYTGGIVGNVAASTSLELKNVSYTTGTVTGTSSRTGGFIGNAEGTITFSGTNKTDSSAMVTGANYNSGGIIGAEVKYCEWTPNI